MKRTTVLTLTTMVVSLIFATGAYAFFGGKFKTIKPENGLLKIGVADIDDGRAHYFKARADDGTEVSFFVLKSQDGVIRAAVDACDVCYRAGKGYVQAGDYMVCENCGQKFSSNRINVVKGGCNPAPLERQIQGEHLVISMAEINANSWYCQYKN